MASTTAFFISLLSTFLFPTFVSDHSIQFSNSCFSVIFFICVFLFLRYAQRQHFSRRLYVFGHIFGFLLSAITACGYALKYSDAVPLKNILFLISILIFSHLYAQLIGVLWTFFQKTEITLSAGESSSFSSKALVILTSVLQKPLVLMGIMLLFWTPCFLSTFPGGFKYDATAEFAQMVNGYNLDFPLLHSFVITKILSLGYDITGSYNTGIAFYTITQMLLLSGLFSNILCTLCRQKINSVVLGSLFAYYTLFPVIHMLVTYTGRDLMFSGLLTYSVFLLYQLSLCPADFLRNSKKSTCLAVALALTLLARNNGTGLLMLFLLVLICCMIGLVAKKGLKKRVFAFSVKTIGSYILISIALLSLCQPIVPAKTNSSLSLFSQCIVRTYLADGENWSLEDRTTFEKYISSSDLHYVPENGDSTKWSLSIASGEIDDFLIFWTKIGLRYPASYLSAALANTRAMWFPGAVADGYQESGIASYEKYDKCYFSFHDRIESPGEHQLYLPAVREFYKNIGLMLSFEKIPVVSMLFSIGFHFLLLLNCIFYAEYRKNYHLRLPLLVLLAYTLISAFVPLVLLRYFCALFFAFPLVVVFTLQPNGKVMTKKDDQIPAGAVEIREIERVDEYEVPET